MRDRPVMESTVTNKPDNGKDICHYELVTEAREYTSKDESHLFLIENKYSEVVVIRETHVAKCQFDSVPWFCKLPPHMWDKWEVQGDKYYQRRTCSVCGFTQQVAI